MSIAAVNTRPSVQRETPETQLLSAAFLACAILFVGLIVAADFNRVRMVAAAYLYKQDLPVAIIAVCAYLVLFARYRSGEALSGRLQKDVVWSSEMIGSRLAGGRMLTAGFVALVVGGVLGRSVVFQDYLLTRDEQMVLFDAAIFLKGQLIAPLHEEWRAFVFALNDLFQLRPPGAEGWVSSYLPNNAVLHSAALAIGLPQGADDG